MNRTLKNCLTLTYALIEIKKKIFTVFNNDFTYLHIHHLFIFLRQNSYLTHYNAEFSKLHEIQSLNKILLTFDSLITNNILQ